MATQSMYAATDVLRVSIYLFVNYLGQADYVSGGVRLCVSLRLL